MTQERSFRSRETGLPGSKQHWILLTDVTCADVNRVLEIYRDVTKKPVPTVEEEEFERLKHELKTGSGIVPLAITSQTQLEWRRLIKPSGVYLRFKFGGGNIRHVFRDPVVEERIQQQIDDHFKDRSKPLNKIR